MNTKRREFLKASAATGAAVCMRCAHASEGPVLTVGMMSDTHVTTVRSSVERSRLALEFFKRRGVGVVAHLGDLADWHYPEAYTYYREALDAVYPPGGRRPEFLYAFGNHDALDPARMSGPPANRQTNRYRSFVDMKNRLGIDHGYMDVKVIAGYPFIIFPETLEGDITIDVYERTIAETCAKFKEGPVFVLVHPPPYQTTYNSCFQSSQRRRILNRFPRVVSINGHKHASVKNELCIWQGEFTAIQTSCLQKWYGLNVGGRIVGKESWGVSIMEIYRDRLVVRRYDLRDGSEYLPGTPWTIPLPFVPETAPYSGKARARMDRDAVFGADAKVSVEADAVPFSAATVRFPTVSVPESVLLYRVEIARRSASGAWTRFTATDVFGDFYERVRDRTGALKCTFPSAMFDEGEEYRFSAVPVGFFGKESKPIAGIWRAPAKAPVETVWECGNPMDELKVTGRAKVVRKGEWYECGPGEFMLRVPENVLNRKGRHRFVVDMHTVQENVPCGVVFGVDRAIWASGIITPVGDSGMMRYVFDAGTDPGKTDQAFKFAGKGGLRIKFSSLRIDRL